MYINKYILFEGVCGSKRTVLMTRARITRFGHQVHVPIWSAAFAAPAGLAAAHHEREIDSRRTLAKK